MPTILAREIAVMSPIAVAGALRCVVTAGEKALAGDLAEERGAVMRTIGTKDQEEGSMAFLERRQPRFTGE